jgi:hypothetical protein
VTVNSSNSGDSDDVDNDGSTDSSDSDVVIALQCTVSLFHPL